MRLLISVLALGFQLGVQIGSGGKEGKRYPSADHGLIIHYVVFIFDGCLGCCVLGDRRGGYLLYIGRYSTYCKCLFSGVGKEGV